jgi:uncharacterized protein YjdB
VSAERVPVGDSAQALASEHGVSASPARWSSSDSTVVRIGASGWFHGLRPGVAILSARRTPFGAVDGSIAVNVVPGVRVTPRTVEVRVGGEARLASAIEGFPDGVDLRVRWSSSDTAVATVSDAGVVTGRRLGIARVEARSAMRPETYGSARVTVAQSIPISLIVTPSTATLVPGATLQLTAALRDEFGTSSGVTYTSSDPRVATVSASGLARALESGVAIITVASFRDATFRTTVIVNVREPSTRAAASIAASARATDARSANVHRAGRGNMATRSAKTTALDHAGA